MDGVLLTLVATLVGCLLGWAVTHAYAKKGNAQLDAFKDTISESLNNLLEKEGATQSLLEKAIQEIGKENPDKAREFSGELGKRQNELAEAVLRVEKTASVSLDHSPLDRTTRCHQCGKPAHPAGFAGGPGGGWVMWYQCPEHGRFPGAHIDDMMED